MVTKQQSNKKTSKEVKNTKKVNSKRRIAGDSNNNIIQNSKERNNVNQEVNKQNYIESEIKPFPEVEQRRQSKNNYDEPEYNPQQEYEEPEYKPKQEYEEPEYKPQQEYEDKSIEYNNESPKNKGLFLILSIGITLISLGLLAVGIYILVNPTKYKNNTTATITAASCTPGTSICTIDVKYNVNNTDYAKKDVSVKSQLVPGQTIEILYEIDHPDNFIIANPKWIRLLFGITFTLISIIMIIVTWWYYKKN